MNGGRIRPDVEFPFTSVVNGQLEDLFLDLVSLKKGDSFEFNAQNRDYAAVLIRGRMKCRTKDGTIYDLGCRPDPFSFLPSVLMFSGPREIIFHAGEDTFLALGSAVGERSCPIQLITPEMIRENTRGQDNWTRQVRLVCWSDNSRADRLMVGETVTPSGNWSTVPPHRHARYLEEKGEILEVPYREIYFYQFSKPAGFGMNRQFDDDGSDNAFSLISNDAVYIDGGYHPVVCAPGSDMYQLTLMSGTYRQSTASVHPDYEYLLNGEKSPFRRQEEA